MLRLGGVGGLGEPRGRHGSDVALVHVRVRRCRPKLLPENMERGSSPVAALVELIGHHAAAVHDVHLDLGLVVVIGREGLVRVQPLLQRGRVRVSWTACKLLHVESLVCLTATNKGKRVPKVIFFSKDLSLLPETSAAMEHFKLVFGSGNSSPAKIRPLKNWPPPFPGSHRLLGTSILVNDRSIDDEKNENK